MSLLRNSVIVGGATFLVGSAFMEIGKADSKSDIGKWPYVATFLSGALGFYLLKQNFIPVPKALELDAESLREEYERHWGEIDDEGAKGLIRCGGCDEATSYYDEMKFCEACQGRKNAESSSSLQSFAAEVFEADRKIRRRTRWTWTRGCLLYTSPSPRDS